VGARRLQADAVDLNPAENRIQARGKVTVTEGPLKIEGDEAQVEVKSSRGEFRNAVLRYANSFYAEGRKLAALGDNRFQVTNGKISFCQDCPQSWSVFGTSIELEIEGYAEIHHALVQVKDQPIAYFPIFYFPIKTKRQSGLLIPEFAYSSELGAQMGQPYFWAIAPDQDATLNYRFMERGGHRVATEYRYRYSSRTFVDTKGSFVRNFSLPNVDQHRYGFNMAQRWQLSPHWVQRYEGALASDTRFPATFSDEFLNPRLPTLTNKASVAWQNAWAVGWVQGFWNANNLIRDDSKGVPSQGSLNADPELRFSVPSFSLLGPLRMQADVEHLRLTRKGSPVDDLGAPGLTPTGWLRTGDRTTLKLRHTLARTLGDLLLSETSLDARADLYSFEAEGFEPYASRVRGAIEQRLSAQLHRVYDVDLGELRAIKHTWEPLVSWGYSPNDARSNHPFFDQVDSVTGLPSPKFDIYDPTNANIAQLSGSAEEARLRPHHLASWGLGSRLVGRYERDGTRVYEEIFGLFFSQDYDLRQKLARRLNILAYGGYGIWRVRTEIALDTKTKAADVRNEVAVTSAPLDLRLEQSLRKDLETYRGTSHLKLLLPWSFAYAAEYDAIHDKFGEQSMQVRYDSNASKCWYFTLDRRSRPDRDRPDKTIVEYIPMIGLVVNEAGVSL
jgi:hypothetical protein